MDNRMLASLRDAKVGDRIRVTDTYEGVVTRSDDYTVTVADRYGLDAGILEDIPEDTVRQRRVELIASLVPDILPVGSLVKYGEGTVYVQTNTGFKNIGSGWTHSAPTMLATDVREGAAEWIFNPEVD